jgi:hypothetical protein
VLPVIKSHKSIKGDITALNFSPAPEHPPEHFATDIILQSSEELEVEEEGLQELLELELEELELEEGGLQELLELELEELEEGLQELLELELEELELEEGLQELEELFFVLLSRLEELDKLIV